MLKSTFLLGVLPRRWQERKILSDAMRRIGAIEDPLCPVDIDARRGVGLAAERQNGSQQRNEPSNNAGAGQNPSGPSGGCTLEEHPRIRSSRQRDDQNHEQGSGFRVEGADSALRVLYGG